MELYKKVKYIINRFMFHGMKFAKDMNEAFKETINTAEKAKTLLRTGAKVSDLYKIESAIDGKRFSESAPGSYMPSTEYILYDDNGFKLYFFNGEKNDFLSDEEILKVSDIINSISNKPKYVYAFKVAYKYQFYFRIHEGKNGVGDFVDDDMKNVLGYLDKMKEAGATWRTITDMRNDIPDDVSDWAITFTIE